MQLRLNRSNASSPPKKGPLQGQADYTPGRGIQSALAVRRSIGKMSNSSEKGKSNISLKSSLANLVSSSKPLTATVQQGGTSDGHVKSRSKNKREKASARKDTLQKEAFRARAEILRKVEVSQQQNQPTKCDLVSNILNSSNSGTITVTANSGKATALTNCSTVTATTNSGAVTAARLCSVPCLKPLVRTTAGPPLATSTPVSRVSSVVHTSAYQSSFKPSGNRSARVPALQESGKFSSPSISSLGSTEVTVNTGHGESGVSSGVEHHVPHFCPSTPTEMDWDDSDVIELTSRARQLIDPQDLAGVSGYDLYSQNTLLEDKETASSIKVVDTNIYIGDLNLVKQIWETEILAVPWTVIQELDHLKVSVNKKVAASAREATRWIQEQARTRKSGIIFQKMSDIWSAAGADENPDDRILLYCIYLKDLYGDAVSLLTNDVNLATKAEIEEVKAVSSESINLHGLSHIETTSPCVTSEATSPCGTSEATSPRGTFKANRSRGEQSVVSHRSLGQSNITRPTSGRLNSSLCSSLPSPAPGSRLPPPSQGHPSSPAAPRLRQSPRLHSTVRPVLTSSNCMQPSRIGHTTSSGSILEGLRRIGHQFLEDLLVEEMKSSYDKDWFCIIKVKPKKSRPYWSHNGLFTCFSKHHMAVFSINFNNRLFKNAMDNLNILLRSGTDEIRLENHLQTLVRMVLDRKSQVCKIEADQFLCKLEALRSSSLSIPEHLRSSSSPVPEHLRSSSSPVPENLRSSSLIPKHLRSSSQPASEHIHKDTLGQQPQDRVKPSQDLRVEPLDSDTMCDSSVDIEEGEPEDSLNPLTRGGGVDGGGGGGGGRVDDVLTLLTHIWHIVSVVTQGLCVVLGVGWSGEMTQPKYSFSPDELSATYFSKFSQYVNHIGICYEEILKSGSEPNIVLLCNLLNHFKIELNIKAHDCWKDSPSININQLVQFFQQQKERAVSGFQQLCQLRSYLQLCYEKLQGQGVL